MRSISIAAIALLFPLTALAAKPQTVVLDVQNMTCAVCPVTVKKSLEHVSGVTGVKVDFDRKVATVRFDAQKANPAALVQATTDAGYPSTLRK